MSQNDPNQPLDRRGFLGTVATGVAAMGMAALATPLNVAAENTNPFPESDPSEAWFNKIKGTHRIVFDATSHHDSFPLLWSRVFLMTNNATGSADKDLGVVVVLRHDAIPLAMEDRLWSKYKFGEVFKINDKSTNAPSTRNFYWKSKEGDLVLPTASIDQLQANGVLFCVCDMALTVYSGILGKNMGMDGAEIKKDWVSGIHPGIQIVPSGVWAVGRAQEHKCGYCFAG